MKKNQIFYFTQKQTLQEEKIFGGKTFFRKFGQNWGMMGAGF